MSQSDKKSHSPTTLYDHIRELQMRLSISAGVLAIAGIIIYLFYSPILKFLSAPLGTHLYYSSPAGGFGFIMKICFTGALIIAIPVLAYNLIMFVRPAFKQIISMKRVFMTTLSSTVLAIAGAIFAFTCILPGCLSFFAGFQISGLSALISADNYLNFVTNIITTFVIVFQIPLIIAFIDSIKPLPPKKLLRNEKWVILGSLIVALIVPFTYDLVTSLLIALPIIMLYNLSIAIVVVKHNKIARKNAKNTLKTAIIKSSPALNKSTSGLALSEQAFELFADELADLDKTDITPNNTCMDIKSSSQQPDTVKPAAWVEERKRQRLELNKQNRVYSDINRPQTNRVLASQ